MKEFKNTSRKYEGLNGEKMQDYMEKMKPEIRDEQQMKKKEEKHEEPNEEQNEKLTKKTAFIAPEGLAIRMS